MTPPLADAEPTYEGVLNAATAEFRSLVKELQEKHVRFRRLRTVIFALSSQLGRAVPADVLASADKREVATRKAIALACGAQNDR